MAKNETNDPNKNEQIRKEVKKRQQATRVAAAKANKSGDGKFSRGFTFGSGIVNTKREYNASKEQLREAHMLLVDQYADKLMKQGAAFIPSALGEYQKHRNALSDAVVQLKRMGHKYYRYEEDANGARAAKNQK